MPTWCLLLLIVSTMRPKLYIDTLFVTLMMHRLRIGIIRSMCSEVSGQPGAVDSR